MDAIQHIATVFEKDCVRRLKCLERAQTIIDYSENSQIAWRLIFIQAEIYAHDIKDLDAVLPEIDRLKNCIQSTGVMMTLFLWTCSHLTHALQDTIDHARKLYALNFKSIDGEVFKKEICYSYACKMMNSVGPRLHHFSNSPTSTQVVQGELYLAMHSPYVFGDADRDLFCYETMD